MLILDFPTPPLPDSTKILCLMVLMRRWRVFIPRDDDVVVVVGGGEDMIELILRF